MERHPQLEVQICLQIRWDQGRQHEDAAIQRCLDGFALAFREEHWPGKRLPHVYYDPRSLKPIQRGEHRPVQHSKCIVVDNERALVTSANFSESAHHRNIEAGVLIEDAVVATQLRAQFDLLMRGGLLCRLDV